MTLNFNRILAMTKDDFLFLVETKTPHDFIYKGKVYNLNFDKAADGSTILVFGPLFEGKKYSSTGEFLNTAKIDNHFFKDMLDIF